MPYVTKGAPEETFLVEVVRKVVWPTKHISKKYHTFNNLPTAKGFVTKQWRDNARTGSKTLVAVRIYKNKCEWQPLGEYEEEVFAELLNRMEF